MLTGHSFVDASRSPVFPSKQFQGAAAPATAGFRRYDVYRRVGRDSQGDVCLAHTEDGRDVVVRTLAPELARDSHNVLRFYRQAKLAMEFASDQLVAVLDVGEVRGTHSAVGERPRGESLEKFLARRGPLPEAEAIALIESLVAALEPLHRAGVVHRGIEPSQLLVSRDDQVVLPNLRQAAPIDDPLHLAPWPQSMRSLAYVAPEQIRDERHADVRADVYAVAATLYTLVTGRAPFQAGTATELLRRKTHHSYRDAELLVPTLSRGLVEAIRQGLMADPARRPGSLRELLQALGVTGGRIGGYELLEQLGRGHTATVFRARSRDGRLVALKVLSDESTIDESRLLRFYQGAKLLMDLNHPNLVQVIEVGCDRDRHFFAMEYVDGENLAWHVRKAGPLPEAEALRIVIEIADGLHELHGRRMVHRDVKPSNILLDRNGRAKLTDPGFAKDLDADIGLTADTQGLGTPQYMAPEQFQAAKYVGSQADVYSLAATLYVLLTGRLPFRGDTPMDKLMAKEANQYDPPEEVNPRLSRRTARLIHAAMHFDPSRRPADARDFAGQAAACLTALGRPESVFPDTAAPAAAVRRPAPVVPMPARVVPPPLPLPSAAPRPVALGTNGGPRHRPVTGTRHWFQGARTVPQSALSVLQRHAGPVALGVGLGAAVAWLGRLLLTLG